VDNIARSGDFPLSPNIPGDELFITWLWAHALVLLACNWPMGITRE